MTQGGTDVPADLTFDEEFRLGGSDTRPEEGFFRVGRGGVGVDDQGRIHVLDYSTHQVQIFESDGIHLRTLGGPGDGPGEIGIPGGLAVSPEGVVGVIDFSRRGMVRWGPDGEVMPAHPLPTTFSGGIVELSGESLVLPIRTLDEADGALVQSIARIADADTLIVASMPPVEMRPITLASCGMSFSGMGRIFAPTLRWTAAEGRIAVATSPEYDVLVLGGDAPPVRVRRDLAPRTATERMAIDDLGEGMQVRLESGVVVCDPAEVVAQRGFDPVIQVVGQLAIAPDGTLWVQRHEVQDEPRAIDLFASDGNYLGTLPPGSPFPIAFLPDGRIAAGITDELDVQRLVVYRVGSG